MGYKLLALTVNRIAEVTVVIVYIGGGLGNIVFVNGDAVAGSHSLGKTACVYNGNNIGFMPCLALYNVCGNGPVRDDGGTLFGSHVEPGHFDKVVGTYFAVSLLAALVFDPQLEAVVHFLVGDVVEGAANRLDVIAEDHAGLVNDVDTPVIEHTAAVLLDASPVGGDTAAAVDTGLDVDDLTERIGFKSFLCSLAFIGAAAEQECTGKTHCRGLEEVSSVDCHSVMFLIGFSYKSPKCRFFWWKMQEGGNSWGMITNLQCERITDKL